MGWKTDWLYQRLFHEVKQIWDRAQQEAASAPDLFGTTPERFHIQQCGEVDWNRTLCLPPVLREWTYAGADFQEQVPTETVDTDLRTRRGAFYPQALIQFYIHSDRQRIAFTYVLGPRYGRGYVWKAHDQGSTGRLILDTDANGWVS